MREAEEAEFALLARKRMEKRIIAEMPIYAFSPEEYEKRCNEAYRRKLKNLIDKGYSEESANAWLVTYSRRRQWRYNPLVGMLCLYVKNDDSIYFGLYCRDGEKKYTIHAEYYTLFPNRCTDVSVKLIVFYNDTNNEIRRRIKAKIKDLQSLEHIKKFYIDIEAFDNIASAVNFKKLLIFTG